MIERQAIIIAASILFTSVGVGLVVHARRTWTVAIGSVLLAVGIFLGFFGGLA